MQHDCDMIGHKLFHRPHACFSDTVHIHVQRFPISTYCSILSLALWCRYSTHMVRGLLIIRSCLLAVMLLYTSMHKLSPINFVCQVKLCLMIIHFLIIMLPFLRYDTVTSDSFTIYTVIAYTLKYKINAPHKFKAAIATHNSHNKQMVSFTKQ